MAVPQMSPQGTADGQLTALRIPANPGYRITQGFHSAHHGLDICGPVPGQRVPVLAAAAGIVRRASYSPSSGYGHVVILYHGQLIRSKHTYTLYGHLGRDDQATPVFEVAMGQSVQQGQVLGTSGNSNGGGWSMRVHLHFELILRDAPFAFPSAGSIGLSPGESRVDPTPYLVGRLSQATPGQPASAQATYGSRRAEEWAAQQQRMAWFGGGGRRA